MAFVVSSRNLDVLLDCEISCNIELIYRSAYERMAIYFNGFCLCIFSLLFSLFTLFFFEGKVLFKIQTFSLYSVITKDWSSVGAPCELLLLFCLFTPFLFVCLF